MGSSSMSATRERTPLQFAMPSPPAPQGPKLDDGGSGGDIGKIIHNGGGGGGDDDDDDDTFGDGEEGDGDGEGEGKQNSYFRTVIPEAYDTFSVGAVLAEWFRTVADLPLIMRRAVEMGLFSSAQLVRFFSMDVRPGVARTVSRALPPAVSEHGKFKGITSMGPRPQQIANVLLFACNSLPVKDGSHRQANCHMVLQTSRFVLESSTNQKNATLDSLTRTLYYITLVDCSLSSSFKTIICTLAGSRSCTLGFEFPYSWRRHCLRCCHSLLGIVLLVSCWDLFPMFSDSLLPSSWIISPACVVLIPSFPQTLLHSLASLIAPLSPFFDISSGPESLLGA